jgi:hypothetical protein
LDHLCDSLNLVAFGINQRLYDGGGRSYPAGHRHRRYLDPGFSRSKTIVVHWTLFGRSSKLERRGFLFLLVSFLGTRKGTGPYRARKAYKATLAFLQAILVIAFFSWAFAQGGDIFDSLNDPFNNQGISAKGNYTLVKQINTGSTDPVIREFVRLVNAKRLNVGCPNLKWDDRIAAIAQEHSQDMVSRNFFNHTDPDGKNSFERLKESNLPYSAAAENIALGPRTGREVYDSWLKSPEHRRNMLDCRYTWHGVGRAGNRWTHILFKP